ncbi:twin-arginine translocation signal domain-containing protein [Rhizobium sp.]
MKPTRRRFLVFSALAVGVGLVFSVISHAPPGHAERRR